MPDESRYARATGGLGIEMVELRGAMRTEGGEVRERERFLSPTGRGVVVEVDDPPADPLRPLDEGARRIVQSRRRGTVHPAELVGCSPAHGDGDHGDRPPGTFVEHDLDAHGQLAPVSRAPALNEASVVVAS